MADEIEVNDAESIYLHYYKDPKNLNRAIEKLDKSLKANPYDFDALILLSRVWLTYGNIITKSKDEKLKRMKRAGT